MLGALLAGVRRALPYVGDGDAGDAAVGRHADALFRMLHAAPFGVRVQALALLQQLLADRAAMSDRFYRRGARPRRPHDTLPCSSHRSPFGTAGSILLALCTAPQLCLSAACKQSHQQGGVSCTSPKTGAERMF